MLLYILSKTIELLCNGMPLRELVLNGGMLYRTTFLLQMVLDRVKSCHSCFLLTWSSSVRLLKVCNAFLIYVMCMSARDLELTVSTSLRTTA